MDDTLSMELGFPGGKLIRWSGQSCNQILEHGRDRGVLIPGDKGSTLVDGDFYELFDLAGKSISRINGGSDLDVQHFNSFVSLIRGTLTEPVAPMREGHISTLFCHLGNV